VFDSPHAQFGEASRVSASRGGWAVDWTPPPPPPAASEPEEALREAWPLNDEVAHWRQRAASQPTGTLAIVDAFLSTHLAREFME
jgi:hypothetical protein